MKIVISGLGVISAIGQGCKESLANFEQPLTPPEKVTLFETPLSFPVFSVKNFSTTNYSEQRTISLLLNALNEALENANLNKNIEKLRVGVCLGTTVACQLNDIDFYRSFRDKNITSFKPIDRFLNGNIADLIKRKLKLNGPSITVANACSSGTDAIGMGTSWIRNGLCDIVISGGADEINRIPLAGFDALGVISNKPCAPFDKNRSGLNLGEGAGIVILESESHAKKRKVSTQLSVAAYSSAADAYHLTAPSPEGTGLKKAITTAISIAGITIEDIGFINAHGTSTRENDKTEGKVFAELFNSDLKYLSTKGYTGHTLGAAGGIEAVFASLALLNGWLPLCAGFVENDDEIPISPLLSKTKIDANFALSTSLAFGGNNSALIIKKEI